MDGFNHLLESWWVPALILTSLIVSIWRSARRLARLSAAESQIQREDTRELHTKAPFRRADFAAKAEIVRKERVKGTVIAMVILFAWGPSLFAISRLVPNVPRGSLIAYQAILFVAAMGSLLVFTERGSSLARRSGLICPGCGKELAGTSGARRSQYLIQDGVLETGTCPGCRAQLLDPSEVGSVSQTLTPADHVRYIGIIAALVAGIIAMVYFGHRQVNANAWARCRRLYAQAYSASDSVVVDSTRLDRGGRVGCEYFRRTHDL